MNFGWAVEDDGRTLGAEELSRDVESLAADDNDLLAVEELLGDNGGETAKEMALAVNDDLEDAWLAFDVRVEMCVHAHHVCVSSRRESIVVSCQRREAAAATAIQRKQVKSEIIIPISSSLNPMLPFGCHAVAIVRKHPPAPRHSLLWHFDKNDFGFPRRKTTNMCVRAHHRNYLLVQVLTTDSNDDIVPAFFRGVGKKKVEKKERHTNPHRREFVAVTCCGLVVPGQKLVEVSRDTK